MIYFVKMNFCSNTIPNTAGRNIKEKWGGVPFLPYVSAMVHRGPVDLGRLAKKL